MAIIGLVTNEGLTKTREAQNNEGWSIYPTGFGVSSQIDGLIGVDASQIDRTISDTFTTFYEGGISSYTPVDTNTLQVSLLIPANQTSQGMNIREIYLYAMDVNSNQRFLLALGQSTNLTYDPNGEVTIRLLIRILNADLSSLYDFHYTQAYEVTQHNINPDAHPALQDALSSGGLFSDKAKHRYAGQAFDRRFPSESFPSGETGPTDFFTQEVIDEGVSGNFPAVYFDELRQVYDLAIADGSEKSKVVGLADYVLDNATGTRRTVVYSSGFVRTNFGYPAGALLYLHPTMAGMLSDIPSSVPIGLSVGSKILLRINHQGNQDAWINSVCSDEIGPQYYPDLVDAIAACPVGGWVRVDKTYALEDMTPIYLNKQVNILFTGARSGVAKFLGTDEVQTLTFSAQPTSGSFVLEHDGNKTPRIQYNADAATIRTALGDLASIEVVPVVEKDGLDIIITLDENPYPLIELGTFLGTNEIQSITFDWVGKTSGQSPSGGSFRLAYGVQQTASITSENTATDIQVKLIALAGISNVLVSGDYATGFLVTFRGVDGNIPQTLLAVADSSLNYQTTSVVSTVAVETAGVLPDNTLNGGITIASTRTIGGKILGSSTAFVINHDNCQILGQGVISGFAIGVDFNQKQNCKVEMTFVDNLVGVDSTGLYIEDFNTNGSLGIGSNIGELENSTLFRELVKVSPTIPRSKSVTISGARATTGDGSSVGLVIDQNVSAYSGGQVDFDIGVVAGGGGNFAPYTALTEGNYYKYAVILNSDNTISVLPPTGEADNALDAPMPSVVGGLLRAVVCVRDDGSNGIALISGEDIQRFYGVGQFTTTSSVRQVKLVTSGSTSVFSTLPEFTFNTSDDIYDLDATIDGVSFAHDTYTKLSNSSIQFSSPVTTGKTVIIKYRDNILSDNVTQVACRVEEITSDGVNSEFTLSSAWNHSPDSDINDIEVFINQAPQHLRHDVIKTSNRKIKFILDDGISGFVPPTDQIIIVKSRVFSSGGSITPKTLSAKKGITQISDSVSTLNFSGDNITVVQDPPGTLNIAVLQPEPVVISSVGTGVGEMLAEVLVDSIKVRRIKAGEGIIVTVVGNDVIISLAKASYFVEYINGIEGISIPLSAVFDVGTKRLAAYRNGIRMHMDVVGNLAQRFAEMNGQTLRIYDPAEADDTFIIINEEISPLFQEVVSQAGVTVYVPAYELGTGKLIAWRNGLLMNAAGHGDYTLRYAEVSDTQIQLEEAAEATDVFIFEHLTAAPTWREDITSFVGNTLTFQSTYTVGDKKLFLYRNGCLMLNSTDGNLGVSSERYYELSTNSVYLETGASINDCFTAIYK